MNTSEFLQVAASSRWRWLPSRYPKFLNLVCREWITTLSIQSSRKALVSCAIDMVSPVSLMPLVMFSPWKFDTRVGCSGEQIVVVVRLLNSEFRSIL